MSTPGHSGAFGRDFREDADSRAAPDWERSASFQFARRIASSADQDQGCTPMIHRRNFVLPEKRARPKAQGDRIWRGLRVFPSPGTPGVVFPRKLMGGDPSPTLG
jgi:hypothetical protein